MARETAPSTSSPSSECGTISKPATTSHAGRPRDSASARSSGASSATSPARSTPTFPGQDTRISPRRMCQRLDEHRSIERFHRTLLEEWAYARPYVSNSERAKAYPDWLHRYNHHRGHPALGGRPPVSRVTNLSGQYS